MITCTCCSNKSQLEVLKSIKIHKLNEEQESHYPRENDQQHVEKKTEKKNIKQHKQTKNHRH